MKKLLTTASAALLLAGIAAQAQASDGIITFKGEISAVSCTPSVSGGTATSTVTLPTVSTKALAVANTTAGSTQFSIALTNCGGGTKAATWFEAGSTVDAASGRLTNAAGDAFAKNVQVALHNSDDSQIVIGRNASTAVDIVNEGATMNFNARYYATAAVTAGRVETSVNYTIQYQ